MPVYQIAWLVTHDLSTQVPVGHLGLRENSVGGRGFLRPGTEYSRPSAIGCRRCFSTFLFPLSSLPYPSRRASDSVIGRKLSRDVVSRVFSRMSFLRLSHDPRAPEKWIFVRHGDRHLPVSLVQDGRRAAFAAAELCGVGTTSRGESSRAAVGLGGFNVGGRSSLDAPINCTGRVAGAPGEHSRGRRSTNRYVTPAKLPARKGGIPPPSDPGRPTRCLAVCGPMIHGSIRCDVSRYRPSRRVYIDPHAPGQSDRWRVP